MLTQAELKQLLIYDPVTGVFTNRVTRNSRSVAGHESGTVMVDGYRLIMVNHRRHLAHRLAWLYVHGQFPDQELDHKDGNRDNNSITNLRPATRKQNMENQKLSERNKSGCRGVSWKSSIGKWVVQVGHKGKQRHLGYFTNLNEAIMVAKQTRDQLYTYNKTEYAA